MDSRGYGRTAHVPLRQRRITGAAVLTGLLGLAVGVYALLTDWMPMLPALAAVVAGLSVAVGAMLFGHKRVARTRYRPDPWALPEWLVTGSGAITAALMIVAAGTGVAGLVLPGPLTVPPVPLLPVVAVLAGLLPAVAAPPLAGEARPVRRREAVPA
jgi:energy-coupling factor transport system permease protein